METSSYAWIIDKDHLYEPGGYFEKDEQGTSGPRNADLHSGDYASKKSQLSSNYENHHQFRMYDDDGILYYTGTLYWNGNPEGTIAPEEDYAYGPLGDYGHGSGCVFISYTGKPEWDCG